MGGKLILFHGLPGSGKSTIAGKMRDDMGPENCMIVERDEIRTALFGESYHTRKTFDKRDEAQVSNLQKELIKAELRAGKTVICSDTNLNHRFLGDYGKTAKTYGAELEQVYVDVPVEVAKQRNKARGDAGGRLVPDHVIDSMAKNGYGEDGKMKRFIITENGDAYAVDENSKNAKFLKDFNKNLEKKNPMIGKSIVFLDVDGTLANNEYLARRYFKHPENKKNYPAFYRGISESPVNEAVRDLANKMRDDDDLNIVVLTGRDDSYIRELTEFVEASGVKASRVIAKNKGDFRPDGEFKNEVIENLKKDGFVPVHAIDDRPSSIRTMEKNGIMVSRVYTSEGPFTPDTDFPDPEPQINTVYGSGVCIRCGRPLKSGGNIGPACRTRTS